MSRILLAWELGYNLGHLSRLRPIAARLRERGHSVLVASRDLAGAARVLPPAGVPFVAAPQAPVIEGPDPHLASYAEILLRQGWGEISQLAGILHAWLNLLRMFSPEVVILDHAPTAALAARSLGIRSAWIGTGFEIPPLTTPFPPFPGIAVQRAVRVDAQALALANRVLSAMRLRPLPALRDLFAESRRWLATYAELDHYGARPQEEYVGIFPDPGIGRIVEWPGHGERRLFAYLRSHTPGYEAILQALSEMPFDVICYVPELPPDAAAAFARAGLVLSPEPLRLEPLLANADLCVSYAPAGTIATTLLHGVPQLCAPPHVEANLTALRIEALGAGIMLRGEQTPSSVEAAVRKMLETETYTASAKEFARRHENAVPAAGTVEKIACAVEEIATAAANRNPR